MRKDVADEIVREREAARQEALREGKAAAMALITEVSTAIEAQIAARETELPRLAFAIAERILGEFPREERLVRAVKAALDEHRGTEGLRLRLSPLMEPMLRAALDEISTTIPRVIVEVDESASPDACTMIHPRGRIAVGPFDQLKSIRTAIEQDPATNIV
jgi:flagellar biosynthesis/type III secretory pathway protein FliH